MGHGNIEDLEPGQHHPSSRRARHRRKQARTSSMIETHLDPVQNAHTDQHQKGVESTAAATASFASSTQRGGTDSVPNVREYAWVSAISDYEQDDFRFNDFQPCYIACIRDLEWQIKKVIQEKVNLAGGNGSGEVTGELESLLVRYSSLLDALENIEYKDRVFEEDGLSSGRNDVLTRFLGERRRVAQPEKDHDKVHDALQQNLILLTLGYIYNWDAANSVKRRFGNVTNTLDRVIVGLVGGAALLVPMIIMTYATQRAPRLVIVSLATMLFALGVSLMNDVRRDGVIAATAAYAAVMVVFIGSSDTVDTMG